MILKSSIGSDTSISAINIKHIADPVILCHMCHTFRLKGCWQVEIEKTNKLKNH